MNAQAAIQRENKRGLQTVDGKRTDGGRCTLLAVCAIGRPWALCPHGAAPPGVRVARADGEMAARAIPAGAR